MLYTQEQLDAMAIPSAAVSEAVQRKPIPQPIEMSMQCVRETRDKHLEAQRHLYPIPGPLPDQVKETDHVVTARDGHEIPIRIYTPIKRSGKPSPLIMLYHEGGWCQGGLSDEEHDARAFTRDLNAVCVNIDYRLAPEHFWPTGLHDCYDVTVWAAKKANPEDELLPADPKQGFIVGGVSAGGNFAAVMAQILRDESFSPPITGQYLSVPSLLWDDDIPEKFQAEYKSRRTSTQDPVLGGSINGPMFLQIVQPDIKSPKFCPLLHANLGGLPPAYFQLAGLDPLRDEGLLYARLLKEQKTAVKVDLYENFGHAMWFNWPELEQSRRFFSDTVKGVEWLLQQ